MTTARDIVTQALREGGILALGETAGADSLEEGLKRLNVLIRSTLGSELGELLAIINIGRAGLDTSEALDADYSSSVASSFVPDNTLLHCNLEDPSLVWLDPAPADGARFGVVDLSNNFNSNPLTVDANGKLIDGLQSVFLSTAGTNTEWFYRADIGEWVRSTTLAGSDPIPFPLEFDDFFITTLAFRLSRRYGQEVPPEMMATLNRSRSQFRARYSQKTEKSVDLGLQLINPNGGWVTSSTDFNRGRPWNS